MLLQPSAIPLALYIHMPWCIRKCPYCDFNSHELGAVQLDAVREQEYLDALLRDLDAQLALVQDRPLVSIFVGGGTPSLISAAGYERLLRQITERIPLAADCEITLEANPGTLEHDPFADYRAAGINRLSLGVQSFDPHHLQQLGRIHDPQQARHAIRQARAAGFDRLNVDLMHGLPGQATAQALHDLQSAIECGATHVSWYQLTIEPNTVFFRQQPILPEDDQLADIQHAGEQLLIQSGYCQYEVSAWTREQPSRHNLNYWQFGDYLGIGAGAHGKITQPDGIYRYHKSRLPRDYLAQQPAPPVQFAAIAADDLPFEYLMNALRLIEGTAADHYVQRTGQSLEPLQAILGDLRQRGLLVSDPARLQCTALGMQYLNSVLQEVLK